jgi:RPA family protein
MSADNGGPGRREVAQRLFAAEFEDASLSHSESDEERAPNYVITPTGARVNRLFAVGVLTEVERVNDDVLRARVADPTGAFVTYAGQYQPDAVAFLDRTTPPAFVALTGKARTFEPEDSDRVFTSVRPESVNEVDAATRDRWVVSTAEATLRRVAVFKEALDTDVRGEALRRLLAEQGVDESLSAGVPLAIDHYGTTTAYLEAVRRMAVDALEVVTGDRDGVRSLDLAPDEGGDVEIEPIPVAGISIDAETAGQWTEWSESAEAAGAAEVHEHTEEAQEAQAPMDAMEAGQDEVPPQEQNQTTSAGRAKSDELDATGATEADEDAYETIESSSAEADQDVLEEKDEHDDLGAFDDGDEEAAGVEDVGADEGAEAAESDDLDEIGDFDDELSDDSVGMDADTDVDMPENLGESVAEETSEREARDPADEPEPGTEDETDAETAGEADADFDESGLYELDDDERREVEEEFGTEFTTGSEVDDPGEADIDVPTEPSEDVEAEAEAVAEPTDETAEAEPAESEESTEAGEPAEPAEDVDLEDVDLEDAVVAAMADLDEGDGADREQVVAAVVDEYGASPADAEDAIQSALMSGQCYEPDEGKLKAI